MRRSGLGKRKAAEAASSQLRPERNENLDLDDPGCLAKSWHARFKQGATAVRKPFKVGRPESSGEPNLHSSLCLGGLGAQSRAQTGVAGREVLLHRWPPAPQPPLASRQDANGANVHLGPRKLMLDANGILSAMTRIIHIDNRPLEVGSARRRGGAGRVAHAAGACGGGLCGQSGGGRTGRLGVLVVATTSSLRSSKACIETCAGCAGRRGRGGGAGGRAV